MGGSVSNGGSAEQRSPFGRPDDDGHRLVLFTRRRRALRLYIDALLFSVPIMLLVAVIEPFVPGLGVPPLIKWIIVALLAGLSVSGHVWSPGGRLLGVRYVPSLDDAFVLRSVIERQSWYTLFVASLFLYFGCSGTTRWSMYGIPTPYFGFVPNMATSAILNMLSGVATIVVAVYLYRSDLRALLIGVPLSLLHLVSMHMNGPIMNDWIADVAVARRELQGLPVREGEIEQMQAAMPDVMWWMVVTIGCMLLLTTFWLLPPEDDSTPTSPPS